MSNSFKETRNLTTSDWLSRRGFMIGTVGTGVAMAFVPMTLLGGSAEDVLNHEAFEPTLWYRIDPSGGISVKVTKAEMGQHIGTALARIVAEELEADWEDVSVDYVDTDPKYGLFLTGGSWSVWTSFDQLSRAGAAGRVALIEEGARLLGVAADQCIARRSQVVCGDRQIGYGDIVARGRFNQTYTDEQLANLSLKPAADRTLIGADTQAWIFPKRL
jgi:isoquinoline 1-oxidoreductase beta subunit